MSQSKLFKQLSFLLLVLSVCVGAVFAQASSPSISNHLELSNDRIEPSDSGKFIGGTVNNLNTKSCDVVVRLNVYGVSHTFLSNRSVRRNALEPGGQWNFRIRVSPKAESYEIISVRAQQWY